MNDEMRDAASEMGEAHKAYDEGIKAGKDPADWCPNCKEFHDDEKEMVITGRKLMSLIWQDMKSQLKTGKAVPGRSKRMDRLNAEMRKEFISRGLLDPTKVDDDQSIRAMDELVNGDPGFILLVTTFINLMNESQEFTGRIVENVNPMSVTMAMMERIGMRVAIPMPATKDEEGQKEETERPPTPPGEPGPPSAPSKHRRKRPHHD